MLVRPNILCCNTHHLSDPSMFPYFDYHLLMTDFDRLAFVLPCSHLPCPSLLVCLGLSLYFPSLFICFNSPPDVNKEKYSFGSLIMSSVEHFFSRHHALCQNSTYVFNSMPNRQKR
jgi:hypothetical protein